MLNRKLCKAASLLNVEPLQQLFRHTTTDVASNVSIASSVLPAEEIPGPRSLPLIGTMYKFFPGGEFYNIKNIDDIARIKYQKYGSIVRQEYIPGMFVTSLFDPNDFEKVYKNEGENRLRPQFDFSRMYYESRNKVKSLASRQGEEWRIARNLIQKPMMKPQSIAAYLPKQVDITDDFISYLREIRDPLKLEVEDFLNQARRWSMEAVGVVCYSCRIGTLTVNPDDELQQFMNAAMFFIDCVADLVHGLPSYKYYNTRALKRYFSHYDALFRHSEKYVTSVLENRSESKEDDNILLQMLRNTDGSEEQTQLVIAMCISVLAGGTDSTAVSLTKGLYVLAKHPEIQEKLYQEICEKVPVGEKVTVTLLNKMSYLKAVVKEIHRYMGTTSAIGRVLEEDIIIQGYCIPAKEIILLEHRVACEQHIHYKDADIFKPERHLRDHPEYDEVHPFTLLPFGYGPRMCLGKTLACQELHLGLVILLQAFRVEYHHGELKEITRAFTVPDREVNLKLIDRNVR